MSENTITDAMAIAAPEWAWALADAIVLGNQGSGNAAVLIERAFEAQLTEAGSTERAAVVAYLGKRAASTFFDTSAEWALDDAKEAIERGDHVPTDPS